MATWSQMKITEGDDGIMQAIFTPTDKEFFPISFLLPTSGEISGPPLDESEPQGFYACRNCGEPVDLRWSDRYNDACEQADRYGMDSLTEGQQTIMEGQYCAECVELLDDCGDIQQDNDLVIDPDDAIIDTHDQNGERLIFWAKDAPHDYNDMAEELKQLFFQYAYIQKKHCLEQTFEEWRDGRKISDAHKIFIMAREGWQLIPAAWYTQNGDDDIVIEEETPEDRLARINEEVYFYTIESLSEEDKELYRSQKEHPANFHARFIEIMHNALDA